MVSGEWEDRFDAPLHAMHFPMCRCELVPVIGPRALKMEPRTLIIIQASSDAEAAEKILQRSTKGRLP